MGKSIHSKNNLTKDHIAIIPARCGSKGFPDKNIAMLGGYPLLSYSVAAAKLSGVDRVLLSTDSEQYASIGRKYGAETPFLRSADISLDFSTDYEWVMHAMNWLMQHEESVPEYWLLLRPTTPLREPKIINNAVEKIQLIPEASSLRSGYSAPESPFKWFLRDQEGFFKSLSGDLTPDMANLPRQQYPATYIPDGYIDIVRSSHVLNKNTLFGDRMFVFESPCTTDFDTKEDFEYLEFQIRQKVTPLKKYLQKFD